MNALSAQLQDPADSLSATEAHGYQPRQLVLVGAGLAHLQLLSFLVKQPMAEIRITLIAPHPHSVYPGMLAGFVAGHHDLHACLIPLEPLVRRAGIRWLQRKVRAFDADCQTLLLDDGSTQHYDWLSIHTGPVQNREQMEALIPGACEFGVFVYPLEKFANLWPRLHVRAASSALRIAIVGPSTRAMELALAVRQRLPHCAITLVRQTTADPAPNASVEQLVSILKQRGVTVLPDHVCSIGERSIVLGCGAQLACDVPLIALDKQIPAWLLQSALERQQDLHIETDAYERSTSHPQVFAAGERSALLSYNVPAAIAGRPLRLKRSDNNKFSLLFGGERHALLGWGRYTMQGRTVRWFKQWADHRQLGQLKPGAA